MKKIIVLLLLSTIMGCKQQIPALKTGLEGKILPEFNLVLPDSVSHLNTNDIPSDKPIILFYFSPRCPYCKAQMTSIVKDINLLSDTRIYIFTDWSFNEMKEFYKHYELNKYPNITVGLDNKQFFINYFKARGVPYTAIYSKQKKLMKVFIGKIEAGQIKKVVWN